MSSAIGGSATSNDPSQVLEQKSIAASAFVQSATVPLIPSPRDLHVTALTPVDKTVLAHNLYRMRAELEIASKAFNADLKRLAGGLVLSGIIITILFASTGSQAYLWLVLIPSLFTMIKAKQYGTEHERFLKLMESYEKQIDSVGQRPDMQDVLRITADDALFTAKMIELAEERFVMIKSFEAEVTAAYKAFDAQIVKQVDFNTISEGEVALTSLLSRIQKFVDDNKIFAAHTPVKTKKSSERSRLNSLILDLNEKLQGLEQEKAKFGPIVPQIVIAGVVNASSK